MALVNKFRIVEKHHNVIIVIFFILSFSFNSTGQNFSLSFKEAIQINDSVQRDSIINFIIDESIKIDSISQAIDFAHRYSLFLYSRKDYKKGLTYVLKEKQIYEENNFFNKDYIKVLFNAGLFSYNNHDYLSAKKYFKSVITEDKFDYRKNNAYFELGRTLNRLGNYHEALDYFIKRLRTLEESSDFNRLISCYLNMSNALNNINTPESINSSLKVLRIADSIQELNEVPLLRVIKIKSALATAYSNSYNYDFSKAKYYHNATIKLGFNLGDSSMIVRTFNNISYLYNLEKNDSSFLYIRKGLSLAKTKIEKARLYDNLADYYILKQNLDAALKSIHKSIELMTDSDFNVDSIPSWVELNNSFLKDYTIYCLKKKSEIYLRLYIENSSPKYLKFALKNIEGVEYLIDLLINGTAEQSTQLVWRQRASQAYLYGAYAAHLLNKPDKVFEFMEKNKALLLSESILKNTEFANLPKHISDEETKQQKLIFDLENKLSKDNSNKVLLDSLFLVKRHHEKYVDSLKEVYPKYFARKISVDQIPLSEVKKELSDNDVVLSYTWNDFDRDKELIVGFITSKNETQSFIINDVKKLRQNILKYQKLISSPFGTKQDQNEFQKVSFQLYSQLFPSNEVIDIIQNGNLMVIADGPLQNISFESLISEENSFNYLINNNNVFYSYSYSFLKHNNKLKRNAENTFIGYAPITFQDSTLVTLKNSETETLEISKDLHGITKLNNQATKKNFLSNSRDSQIIHLATHADADRNPWIAFQDEKLELHELYTFKNNADLVTLSACKTTLGEQVRGEGVISLARGFFFSGSKSVVSSLWSVNDVSTTEIMRSFYRNIKEGQTKSAALNNAKREYLSTHTLSDQSPYYWSSFILIGDPEVVPLDSPSYLYYFSVGALLFLVLYLRRKRKISSK